MKRNRSLVTWLVAVTLILCVMVGLVVPPVEVEAGEIGWINTLTVTAGQARVEFTNTVTGVTAGPGSAVLWSRPAAMGYVMHNPSRVWTVQTYAVVSGVDFLLEDYVTNALNWETTFSYPFIWQNADKFAIEITPVASSNVTFFFQRE